MGTVEFTGLEMIKNMALGQAVTHASAIPYECNKDDITINTISTSSGGSSAGRVPLPPTPTTPSVKQSVSE
jgi:hypothetical protein